MEIKTTEYLLGDLSKKSKTELLDLLNRQVSLLSRKRFIDKLADKGKKISDQKDRIEQALAHLNDVSRTTDLFQRLQLNQHQRKDLDSDDDDVEEQDPSIYETLATNGILDERTEYKAGNLTQIPNESNELVIDTETSSASQAIEIDHHEPNPEKLERFGAKLTEKVEMTDAESRPERFRENRTLHHKTLPEFSKGQNKGPKQLYDTAVTPLPPAKFNEAKLISLQESYHLITEQTQKAKELVIKQAAEQLAIRMPSVEMHQRTIESHFTQYREVHSEDHSDD